MRNLKGTPLKKDRDIVYEITFAVRDDGYKETSDVLIFNLNSQPPLIVGDLKDKSFVIDFEQTLKIPLINTIFKDIYGDPLVYNILWLTDDGIEALLPNWLNYYKDRYLIVGKPTYKDLIYFNSVTR